MHDGQHDVSSRFTRAAIMSHNKSSSLLIVVLYDGCSITVSVANVDVNICRDNAQHSERSASFVRRRIILQNAAERKQAKLQSEFTW